MKRHRKAHGAVGGAGTSARMPAEPPVAEGQATPPPSSVFGEGSGGPKVADLHARLLALGYSVAQEEVSRRYFGKSTAAAVRKLQQDHGLLVDGLVGPETWQDILRSGFSLGDRLLYYTQPMLEGRDVAELQGRLNSLGFACGRADGVFGPATEAALKEFQRQAGLVADGVFGPLTHAALDTLGRRGRHLSAGSPSETFPPSKDLEGMKVYLDTPSGLEQRYEPAVDAEIARFALSVAEVLARKLEGRRALPISRRRTGEFLTADERAALANSADAHIVISMGLNWASDPDAAGTASYYFSGTSGHSRAGRRLAALCQDNLVAALGRPDCRIHGRNWTILRRTQAPACVVEPLTLSNPTDAAMVRDRSVVEAVAEALLAALESYCATE